jgi:hypothetical protein
VSDGDHPAVVIISFNRPQYLAPVLMSISKQENFNEFSDRIFVFQDGSYNPFSNNSYGDYRAEKECLEIIEGVLPSSSIYLSPINLGVALNYDRAEQYVFNYRNFPAAIFFEDDMIVDARYCAIMRQLLSFAKVNKKIGMVSAYGASPTNTAQVQTQHLNEYALMHHNWGFGLTKSFWLRRQFFYDDYLSLIRRVDYHPNLRPSASICELHRRWGFQPNVSSQDMAKAMSTLLSGGVRLTTFANFATYIGRVGLHSPIENSSSDPITDTIRFNDPFPLEDLAEPSAAALADFFEEEKMSLRYRGASL